jgi:hypothetical protein
MSHVLLRKSAVFFCGICEKQSQRKIKDKRKKIKDSMRMWEFGNLKI